MSCNCAVRAGKPVMTVRPFIVQARVKPGATTGLEITVFFVYAVSHEVAMRKVNGLVSCDGHVATGAYLADAEADGVYRIGHLA